MAQIAELRVTLSKNKKYKYRYELIVNGLVQAVRKSNVQYVACYTGGISARFLTEERFLKILPALPPDEYTVGLTFETLLKYKKFV